MSIILGGTLALLLIGAWVFLMACVGRFVAWVTMDLGEGRWWSFPVWMGLWAPLCILAVFGVMALGFYGFQCGSGITLR